MEKTTDKFVYEGIVSEQQGNTLCLKYKDYEAVKLNPKWLSFFIKFRQKGTIRLKDEDLSKLKPYSMEGQKVRVTIELIDY